MSPEDLAQAIAAYKTRRAERLAAKAQADQEDDTVPVADLKPAEGAAAVAMVMMTPSSPPPVRLMATTSPIRFRWSKTAGTAGMRARSLPTRRPPWA